MDGTYRFDGERISIGDGRAIDARITEWSTAIQSLAASLPARAAAILPLERLEPVFERWQQAVAPRLSDAAARLRVQLAAIGILEREEPPIERDASTDIMDEFEKLGGDHQMAVARNLALLWDSFVEHFDGLSGFRQAPTATQDAYLAKLEAAEKRMEASRFTDAGHHFVSVVLMKIYVSLFPDRHQQAERRRAFGSRCDPNRPRPRQPRWSQPRAGLDYRGSATRIPSP